MLTHTFYYLTRTTDLARYFHVIFHCVQLPHCSLYNVWGDEAKVKQVDKMNAEVLHDTFCDKLSAMFLHKALAGLWYLTICQVPV